MAKSPTITVDFINNLHALIDTQCFALKCKYHQEDSLNCNLKQTTIGSDGKCMLFEEEENKDD